MDEVDLGVPQVEARIQSANFDEAKIIRDAYERMRRDYAALLEELKLVRRQVSDLQSENAGWKNKLFFTNQELEVVRRTAGGDSNVILRLMGNVDFIGVDIDGGDTRKLLRAFLTARKLFPAAKLEVRLSSSHSGFHMKILTTVPLYKNFLVRAYLEDCPQRLLISLGRLFASGGGDDNYDILFDKKNGLEAGTPFDLAGFLMKYNKADFSNPERFALVCDELYNNLPMRTYWICCVPFSGNEVKEQMKNLGNEQFERLGIRYRIYSNFTLDSDYLLVSYHENEKDADTYGRVVLQAMQERLSFWVKEIGEKGG